MFTKEEVVNKIFCGNSLDILKQFPDECLDCCVTSPPYWALRDYDKVTTDDIHGIWDDNDPDCKHKWKINDKRVKDAFCEKCGAWRGELGQEPTPDLYIQHLTQIFHEIKRAMKPTGSLWLNLGDSYYKKEYPKHSWLKSKDLIGIPWMAAFSLQKDGWYLRNDIIWEKIQGKPESIKDRCTKIHEYIFFMTKNEEYYYDQDAIREKMEYNKNWKPLENRDARTPLNKGTWINPNPGGKNKRTIWRVNTVSAAEFLHELMKDTENVYHGAMYSEELITPCILAGSPEGGVVFDPFMGSGTTAATALKLKRKYSGTEIIPEYIKIQEKRLASIDLDKIHGNCGLNEIISF
jgi:DNA modification methylase